MHTGAEHTAAGVSCIKGAKAGAVAPTLGPQTSSFSSHLNIFQKANECPTFSHEEASKINKNSKALLLAWITSIQCRNSSQCANKHSEGPCTSIRLRKWRKK